MTEAPLYAPGRSVRVSPVDPAGHSRVPRYVRGHTGRIVEETGSRPRPDDLAARAAQPRVEPVYTVAFAARALWGGESAHHVTVDLWQSSLEPAEGSTP